MIFIKYQMDYKSQLVPFVHKSRDPNKSIIMSNKLSNNNILSTIQQNIHLFIVDTSDDPKKHAIRVKLFNFLLIISVLQS